MQQAGYSEARIMDTGFVQVENRLEYTTVSTVKYEDGKTRSGKIREKKISVMHTFCPFCGTRIKDAEEPSIDK